MEARSAVPTLLSVLGDASDDAIVRHESGEALGAIADPSTLAELEARCHDPAPEVRERTRMSAEGSRRSAWLRGDEPPLSVSPHQCRRTRPSYPAAPHRAAPAAGGGDVPDRLQARALGDGPRLGRGGRGQHEGERS
jgi:hypothetical protein